MAFELLNRWDAKWAHPEAIEGGGYVTAWMTDPKDIEGMTAGELEAARAGFRDPIRAMLPDVDPSVDWIDHQVEQGCPEEPGAPAVHVMVGMPKDIADGEALPVAFCITGGGLTGGGTAELGALSTREAIQRSGMRMVQVCFEYRTAPQDPYPAAVNDCHAAYAWMVAHAGELHIDQDRVVLYGDSTGAHLALCLAFRLKRHGWCGAPKPRGVVVRVPAVYDEGAGVSAGYAFTNPETGKAECWDAPCASMGFKLWLGKSYGDPAISPEALPTNATVDECRGLPPVLIPFQAEFEPGRDAIYDLVRNLHAANVYCDLHVWGGTSHIGIPGPASVELANRIRDDIGYAIRQCVTYDLRRSWLD